MKTPVAPHSLESIKLRLPTHRGAYYGGGREAMAVKLRVTQASWQTQG